jgi:hypothetical protein
MIARADKFLSAGDPAALTTLLRSGNLAKAQFGDHAKRIAA